MSLIPLIPFTSGAVFTPEAANAIATPVFDDQIQYLGHLAKIKDTDLDDTPGAIKSRVANLSTNLKVTAGSGLNAIFMAGVALYGTTVYNIVASSITLAASTNNYVYVAADGTVASTADSSGSKPPILRAMLAMVVTNTTGVISVVDLREGFKLEVIKPPASSIKNFGGRGDSGAFIAVGGELLSDGEYYFTDFTVATGKTITIDKLARIYCTGNVNIAGAVLVTPASAGGNVIAYQANASTTNTYLAPGGVGIGFGAGQAETTGLTYNHIVSPVGSGGAGGYVAKDASSGGSVTTVAGGAGGGCFWIEAAGNITISGFISAMGTAGSSGVLFGATAGSYAAQGGGGGGSGGLILIKALGSIVVTGVINVTGGAGGAGALGTSACSAECGAGGGGGRVVIFSPAVNTTGATFNLAGGTVGTSGQLATVNGFGGAGGSYGGLAGNQNIANGQPGLAGVLITRSFTPVG